MLSLKSHGKSSTVVRNRPIGQKGFNHDGT